jgi:hypothetical protein
MQAEVALNVQQSIRPGECIDTYYAGKENSMKQCAPTVEDNRFFVNVPSLNSGSSSTITFNPNEGLAEVILTLQLPLPSTVTVDGDPVVGQGLALPLGWGYHFIKRIGYRYGSSQLYYISGAQNLMQALALCEDSGKKQQLMNLGGQALLTSADWADAGARTGYVYLRLPHSSPALSGGALPFPSDILTAPIQIQIDFENFDKVISSATVAGQAPSTISPARFQSAVVNFTQVTFQDAGDLVARRFDMSKHALTIPLPEGWTQEEVKFPITAPADGTFQISLTGCKAGDLKKLRVFFTKDSDTSPPAPPAAGAGLYQPNLWYAPTQITFAINGLIYLDSRNGSFQLNNLLRRRTPPSVSYSALTKPTVAGDPYASTSVASTWVEIDLGQPFTIGNSQEVALVHGVPVMNSVMNLTGVLPAQGAWTAHCEYVLNCSWMASRGSAEFIF